MFIGRLGLVGMLIEKGIEWIADKLFKSSMEKDFGEASEDDIILPEARHVVLGSVQALEAPLARMFLMVEGLREGHQAKLAQRLPELRVNREVTYAFQVKDGVQSVELQLLLIKQKNHEVQIDFRSSEGVIKLVRSAFDES